MRKLKLLFIAGFTLTASTLFAQKIDVIKKDVQGGKYAEAKTKIDQFMGDQKNATVSDAQFYKAVIYHNLAKQNSDSASAVAALDAMNQYLQMEQSKPEAQRMLLSTLESHKTLVDIYQTYFQKGVDLFQKQSYASAFGNFEKAINAFQLLKKQNLTTAAFDTTATLYAGYSAQNAQMYDQAAKYYDVIINNNVNDTSYVGLYRFMINSNLEKKDTVTAKKYLGVSETRFPQYKDIWLEYETLFLTSEKPKRVDEYQTLIKANPGNESLAMNYAIEMYNYVRSSEEHEKDPAIRQRTEEALKNVLAMTPGNVSANLLLSQFYWTELYQLQNELDATKGNAAAAIAKRKDLNAKMEAVFDKVQPYLAKTYELYNGMAELRPQDKANFKIVAGQLVDYHNRKKQADKVAEYQAKIKTLQ